MRDASIDYDRHAPAYPRHRRADPRIAARVYATLGDVRTVLNVGAGSVSCEPEGRYVLAVELSAGMRATGICAPSPPMTAACAWSCPADSRALQGSMPSTPATRVVPSGFDRFKLPPLDTRGAGKLGRGHPSLLA